MVVALCYQGLNGEEGGSEEDEVCCICFSTDKCSIKDRTTVNEGKMPEGAWKGKDKLAKIKLI